ncbi:MAG: hypothetical protein U0359_03385 [Byssovorax sp.]
MDGRLAQDHGAYRLTLSVASGASCKNGNAVELTLKPNAHYLFPLQTVSPSGPADVACAQGNAGTGTGNIAYHFLPPKLAKKISVNKMGTYIFADDACVEGAAASQCSSAGSPTLDTSSEYVWIDAGSLGAFASCAITIDTGDLPPP